jgi:hypothetical protein
VRTTKLVAAALALGVLGGAGTGYAVQAARKPAPLPPLAVPQPQYPKVHRVSAPLTAAEDDMVKTDGDLTKLLLPVPAGSSAWENPSGPRGWYSKAAYSQEFLNPAEAAQAMTDDHFRRAAVTTWQQGTHRYKLVLMQFQDDFDWASEEWISGASGYAMADAGGSQYFTRIPDSQMLDGVYAGPNILHSSWGSAYHRGWGLAVHGDIAVIIFDASPDRIDGGALMNLLQSQLERL